MNNILNESYNKKNIIFDKAKKDFLYSKGKKFIDLSYGSGTLILGHGSNIQLKIFKNLVKKKLSLFSGPNRYTLDFTKTLKKILPVHYNKIIFCNSGTEAVIKSLRIARAISGKKLIINVSGSWHGSVDQLLYNANKEMKPVKISDGLNKDEKKNIIYVPYNDFKSTIKILNKNKNKAACILIEPIQGSLPNETSYEYLKKLSEYSKKNKIILIFDEMITGIRANCKSVQEIYKIKPDISTFGKVFGGGMPIGFIGINKKISQKLKSKNLNIHFGGTFTSNPISMYSANETLKFIIKNRIKIFNKINKMSEKFQSEINTFCIDRKLDIRVYKFYSMLRIIYSNKDIKNRSQRDQVESSKDVKILNFKNFLMKKGIFYPNNGIIFFSYQSSYKNFNYLINIFKIGLKRYFNF